MHKRESVNVAWESSFGELMVAADSGIRDS